MCMSCDDGIDERPDWIFQLPMRHRRLYGSLTETEMEYIEEKCYKCRKREGIDEIDISRMTRELWDCELGINTFFSVENIEEE